MTEKATCTNLKMVGEGGCFIPTITWQFAFPYDPPQPFYIQCSQLPLPIIHTVTDFEGHGR